MARDGPPSKRALKLRLRLDDGSLVAHASLLGQDGGAGFVRMPVKECIRHNLAGDAEFQRLQRLLQSPELPELGPATKKAKLESRPSMSAGADWQGKCQELLQVAIKALDKDYHWFVDRVPDETPNYYNLIDPSKAMWINLVKERLMSGEYDSPNKFYDDMRQIWTNCKAYNPPGNLVRIAAERAERKLDEAWIKSGLSTERSRRLTAGHAPTKFDPELVEPAVKSKPSASKGQAPSKSAKKQANGSGRAASQEVVSGGGRARASERGLSAERRQAIATALQDSLQGSLSEEKMNELMSLLPETAMTIDEEGETELDFEALDDATLRHLDEWLRTTLGQMPHTSPSHISVNPSVRLEAASDDDDDYNSDL